MHIFHVPGTGRGEEGGTLSLPVACVYVRSSKHAGTLVISCDENDMEERSKFLLHSHMGHKTEAPSTETSALGAECAHQRVLPGV